MPLIPSIIRIKSALLSRSIFCPTVPDSYKAHRKLSIYPGCELLSQTANVNCLNSVRVIPRSITAFIMLPRKDTITVDIGSSFTYNKTSITLLKAGNTALSCFSLTVVKYDNTRTVSSMRELLAVDLISSVLKLAIISFIKPTHAAVRSALFWMYLPSFFKAS